MGPISFWGNVVPRAFERIGGTISARRSGWWRLLELISAHYALLAVVRGGDNLCGWLALGKSPTRRC